MKPQKNSYENFKKKRLSFSRKSCIIVRVEKYVTVRSRQGRADSYEKVDDRQGRICNEEKSDYDDFCCIGGIYDVVRMRSEDRK